MCPRKRESTPDMGGETHRKPSPIIEIDSLDVCDVSIGNHEFNFDDEKSASARSEVKRAGV